MGRKRVTQNMGEKTGDPDYGEKTGAQNMPSRIRKKTCLGSTQVYFFKNKYGFRKTAHDNYNVLGAEGGSEKLDSAIRPRHTQGREKRRPDNKRL